MISFSWRSLIEYVFRRRSAGATLILSGFGVYALLLTSFAVRVVIPTADGPFSFSWDTTGGVATLSLAAFIVATAVILLGSLLVFRDVQSESRKKVIVVEARGLRDWQGEPLEKAMPLSLRGRRDPMLIDVRQGLVDGHIVNPDVALRRLSGIPDDISRRSNGFDRSDISFVLGGLAPVPLLFLLGVIVDDEHHILFMDWDRDRKMWRPLDDDDDGKRFDVSGLDAIARGSTRVALCVSASYDVKDEDVRLVEPTAPIVRMELQGRSTATHWSEDKQQQLARQFLDTVMALARASVTEISLFLAAPASLSLRFGTIYDKRNLPMVIVNQFEFGDPKKFPWAIAMPVAGVTSAKLETR